MVQKDPVQPETVCKDVVMCQLLALGVFSVSLYKNNNNTSRQICQMPKTKTSWQLFYLLLIPRVTKFFSNEHNDVFLFFTRNLLTY